jgi:hypothetical protein
MEGSVLSFLKAESKVSLPSFGSFGKAVSQKIF